MNRNAFLFSTTYGKEDKKAKQRSSSSLLLENVDMNIVEKLFEVR